jgi:lipopolysaccharide transport system permease protein
MLLEMTRDDLTGRYRGQWFGSAWVFVHPLSLTLLYLFLFGVVFAQRLGGTRELPLNYTAYILSGLIPWLTFQMSMSTAVVAITANAQLVKQFTFPIELLPIRDVLAASVTFGVGMSATLLYVALAQGVVMPTWALIPVIFAAQLAAMSGTALLLSAISVFFRDIKDFVTLFSMVAMFMMPIVYLPGWVPEIFRPVLWLNPFSYMAWVYQDAIYFGRFEHPWAWPIFFGWATLVFIGGFRLFRATKMMFASVL